MRVNSLAGSRYFVTFIDDKSRWCEVYFMKKKSEVIEKFKEYKCLVEKKTERKIKIVRSDNGTEYTRHYLEDFLKQEGIRHELTVEYTPQQNGVAERKNRSLVETARCLMIQSGLSASFWTEAILTANHIRNRCPSRSLGGEIPFKIWTRRTPIASYFRKFGTTAFALD
jgi:transposase InsO family protein